MKRFMLSIALASVLLAGCSSFSNSELSGARNRWQAAHISHYRYKLNVGCFCAFTQHMPLTIEVENGRVVNMSFEDGSALSPQDQQNFAQYQTVDALFDFTAQSIRKADEVKTEYDPAYGFPARVQIDFIKQAVDDELALSVSDFQPLP